MKTLVIIVLSLVGLSGCTEKERVYVDINETEIQTYERLKAEIVCDVNNNAYYKTPSHNAYYSYTPVLYNGVYGTYIVPCDDL